MKRASLIVLLLSAANCGPESDELAAPPAGGEATAPAGANGLGAAVPSEALNSGFGECKGDRPPADGIWLFSSRDFGGVCGQWRMDHRPYSGFRDLQSWNGRARSIKVGADVRTSLFLLTAFRNKILIASSDVSTMTIAPQSLRIELREINVDCGNLRSGQIAFYEHADFRGDCYVAELDAAGNNIDDFGLGNDGVSSLRNRLDKDVILFEHAFCPYFNGRREIFPPQSDWRYVGDHINDLTTCWR